MSLVRLLLEVPAEVAEEVGQVLIELGAGGVEEQPGQNGARLIVYGTGASELLALAESAREVLREIGLDEALGSLSIRIHVDPDSDWDTAWTRHLKPQLLTPLWVVQPIGDETPAPAGLGRIWIRPALAFGDGAHVSTRLAAQAVERFCQSMPGPSVLDIGTGSGILALVAALSGARPVVGLDVDPVALEAARENAEINQLTSLVSFPEASSEIGSHFDLVVANLEPRALLEDAARIAALARSSSELVVTGFLSDQAREIVAAFSKFGFAESVRIDREEFCLLVLVRPRGLAELNPDPNAAGTG